MGTVDGTPVGADDGIALGTGYGALHGIQDGHWTRLCAGTLLDATENAARLLHFSGSISD